VRAHGAGLACPDWPMCFGRWIPRFDFKVAYEWSHRFLASLVSMGLVGLSIGVLRRPELRRELRAPLICAWSLLTVQVVLGGLTVLLFLAPWTVTAHLITGLGFCVTLLWIARDLFEWGRPQARDPLARSVRAAALFTAVVLIAQLLLGGLVSSRGAGLACLSFPTCDGVSFVPSWSGLIGLQIVHRLNGFLLLGAFVSFAWLSRATPRVHRLAFAGVRLVLLQILVGALNVWLQLKVEVTALHTAFAASLALIVGLALREIFRGARAGQASTAGATREWEAPQTA